MVKNKHRKRRGLIAAILAVVLVFGLAGCSTSKDSAQSGDSDSSGSEAASEATTQANTDETNGSYAASDVILPDDFDSMIYPITALMVQDYSKGYDYYPESDEPDSFWYSMAVLTSLMETESAYGDGIEEDSYYYLKEDTSDMYASALYSAYGEGNMEFPEILSDDKYAVYDEDQEMYGFLKGDIGDLTPYITSCTKDDDLYHLKVALQNSETEETICLYNVTLTGNTYDGEDNYFTYSVEGFASTSYGYDDEDTEEESSETEATAEEDTSEEGTTGESSEEEDTSETGESQSSENVSQDSALDMAKDYYGDDAEYSYKETVTVGDKEYYDFSVEGDGISSTDVLVSTDGQDVLGGTKNDDGSWSFDQ